jgi:iron complex transport system ATP-binding protein
MTNHAPLIEFRDVTVKRNGKTVLDSVTLSIDSGEQVAVLGPNGSGKSSLIKTIARECYPLAGSWLRILGSEVWNLFDLRAQMGVVSNELVERCTYTYPAREVVMSGLFGSVGVWPNHHVTPEIERRTDEVLALMEIAHLAERPVAEMSTGEARRVVIGRALVHNPRALVLDEPTTSLDFHAKHELRRTLRRLAQSGIGIVMVTHNLTDIIPEIGRVVLLKEGRVFRDGPKDEVLTAEPLGALFGTAVEVTRRNGYYHIW